MDVWGPARVRGQGHERYFMLVVDDYSRYTTVFPLRSKGEVTEVLIDWIRAARLRLRESFGSDFPVLRLHSDRGGEFSSAFLGAFCRAQGIRQTFTLPASPQQNGIAERRIGVVMDVARTSMIHAAAPHFLWPFAVQYAAHQLNLQPRVSLPETSPTLLWTGKVGDASAFRVWGSRAFVRDLSADKLSPRAVPCVFLGFPPDALGWQFYHPTSRLVLSSQDVTFDESVPAPSGVSQVDADEPVEVPVDSGAANRAEPVSAGCGGAGSGGAETGGAGSGGAETGGVEPGGAETGGAEPGGAESGGAESWGAESGGTEPGGTEPGGAGPGGGESARVASRGASSRREVLSPQELHEWFAWRWGRAAGAGGTTAAPGPGGTAEAAGVGPTGGSARASGGTGAAGSAGTGATGVGATGGVGAGGSADAGTSEGAGAGAPGAGAGAPGAGGATGAGAPAGSPSTVPAGSTGAPRPRPYFVPLLEQVLGLPPSPGTAPPLECPQPIQSQSLLRPVSPLPAPSYTGPTGGLGERRAPASRPASPARPACTSRRTGRPRPPAVPGTHQMALRPSTAPLRVSLPSPPESSLPVLADPESDSLRAASPTVARFLATVVTDPSLASTAALALVAELVDFAARCRLDYAASLVAESVPVCPPSVGGECALGTDVLQDKQEEFQCFAAALPHLVSTLLAPEGDPDAPDIPTPRSYAEAIEGPYSSQWQAAMDAEMASWKSTGTYVDEVPPPGANIAPREWHDTLRTTLAALGFAPSTADPSLFLRTDTALPPFYVLVYVDDLVFATADTAGLAHVKSELQKRHTCTDLGELRSYLGLQITRDRAQRTITLTQSHMVQQVLQRFDFTYSSPQATPLSTRHLLSALPSDESIEPSGPYPELVGCLMYLMTCTRRDLAYPLSILARYVAPGRHRPEHMAAAKRVLRYLCSTSGLGLVLGGRRPVVLTGHADASWADDQTTQRSSQGYTFSLGSGSVSWRSTCSSSVLTSSCEAEIYAGAMAAQELRWLTYLLSDLGEQPRSPPILYVDNKAMLALCREHRLEHRTKHIALRYFLARELQQRGQLRLAYVASEANTADIFTKALAPGDHQRFCTMLDCVVFLLHHRLDHPTLPRLRGMHSCHLVSGLPRSLPPLPPLPAPPCLPCVEGRQRATPHSSFPPTTAPLQTLHMDDWGPARVSGQSRERYFFLVVDDYTRYTTVFPLRSKCQVVDVLFPWIRAVRLQLRERFRQDLPVLRVHSDRGGEFSSNLLQDFCRGEGILQSFTLPESPQRNGIGERHIGLLMEVARTSMIHAAAPHFLWPFAVWYAAHQLNLSPCVSLPETSPKLRWTGEVGDASVFRDVMFDKSVPFYRLFPLRSAPPLPPPLFLAPGPPPVLLEGAGSGGAKPEGAGYGGAEPGGAEPGGAEPAGVKSGGAEPEGVGPGGAEYGGAEPRGPASSGGLAGASPRLSPQPEPLSPQQLCEWFIQRTRLQSGVAGAGDSPAGDTGAGAGGTGGAAAAGPGGARTRGTGAAGTGTRPGGARAVDPGAGGAGSWGAVSGGTGAGGTVWPRPYFVPLLQQVLGVTSATGLTPPLLCPPLDQSQPPLQRASSLPAPSPYTEQTGGLTERREPAS
ncbi:unnamed protein product [Closterium sp. NIES-54]